MATTIETYTGGPDKPTIEKDPDAVLDYAFDWTAYLVPLADTIISAEFVLDGGLVLQSSSHTTTTATAWVMGGTLPGTARLTCRITTADGRTDDRSVFLKIKER